MPVSYHDLIPLCNIHKHKKVFDTNRLTCRILLMRYHFGIALTTERGLIMLTINLNINPNTIARDLWDIMDNVYEGDISEAQALPIMAAMFDYVLPHFDALTLTHQEQVANAAEWLDRINELPE